MGVGGGGGLSSAFSALEFSIFNGIAQNVFIANNSFVANIRRFYRL